MQAAAWCPPAPFIRRQPGAWPRRQPVQPAAAMPAATRAEAAQGQLTASIIYIVAELIFIMFPLLSEEEISPGIYLHTNRQW